MFALSAVLMTLTMLSPETPERYGAERRAGLDLRIRPLLGSVPAAGSR